MTFRPGASQSQSSCPAPKHMQMGQGIVAYLKYSQKSGGGRDLVPTGLLRGHGQAVWGAPALGLLRLEGHDASAGLMKEGRGRPGFDVGVQGHTGPGG